MKSVTKELTDELPEQLQVNASVKSARQINKTIAEKVGIEPDSITKENWDMLKSLWVGVSADGAPINVDRGISDKMVNAWEGSVSETLTGDTLESIIQIIISKDPDGVSEHYMIPVEQAIAVVSVGLAESFKGFMVEDQIVDNTRLIHIDNHPDYERKDDWKKGIDLIDPDTGAKVQVKSARGTKRADQYDGNFTHLVCYGEDNGYTLGIEEADKEGWNAEGHDPAHSQARGTKPTLMGED